MDQKKVHQIVSMIIQNLRISKHPKIVDLIKKSDYRLEWLDYDNWNGGINTYLLLFQLTYTDYFSIFDNKDIYEEIIAKALDSFYSNESEVITNVCIITKIEQFVDWEALEAKENKQSILKKLIEEKKSLIDIATGITKIQYINEEYKAKHKKLCSLLNTICLINPNTYDDLWDWYNDYIRKNLTTYKSRRDYVKTLYAEIIDIINNSKEQNNELSNYIPIGWEKVDNSISRMKEILVKASITTDYQSVGLYGREVLITLAQLVFDKDKHFPLDGIDIGKTDSKRMLEAYINCCLKTRQHPREIKFAKATIDFSNELTHNRTASALDAELCYNAVAGTINIIRILEKNNK